MDAGAKLANSKQILKETNKKWKLHRELLHTCSYFKNKMLILSSCLYSKQRCSVHLFFFFLSLPFPYYLFIHHSSVVSLSSSGWPPLSFCPHYAFLHFPFFSRCWNFRSLLAQVSLHWMTRLPLSATTPLCPGESSSLPRSRYFLPGLIFGHLQATSFALTHKNWSPLRIRLSPCL